MPHRWPTVRQEVGNRLVEQGLELLRQGSDAEALQFLNAGIRKAPRNATGRLASAELRIRYGRLDAAVQMLADGLIVSATDPGFFEPAIRLLLDHGAEQQILAVAAQLWPAQSCDPHLPFKQREILAHVAAASAFRLGQFDSAEDWLRRLPTARPSLEADLLQARIDWERGHRDLVLTQLRQRVDSHPTTPRELHAELLSRLRQSGQLDEWRRRAVSLQISFPNDGRARVELMHAYHHSNDQIAVTRELEAVLSNFPEDRAVLLGLAEFAVANGLPRLTARLLEHVAHARIPDEAFRLLHVEALLAASDTTKAEEELRRFGGTHAAPGSKPAVLECLQATIHVATGDTAAARSLLKTILGGRRAAPEQLVALANRLAHLGAIDEACRILEYLLALDPKNQSALTRLVELELIFNRVESLPGHLRRLVTMRRPSPDLLRVARHKLGSDLFLFSAERDSALEAVESALGSATAVAQR